MQITLRQTTRECINRTNSWKLRLYQSQTFLKSSHNSLSIIVRAETFSLFPPSFATRSILPTASCRVTVSRTCHKMTAKRGRAPVVTARATVSTAEWRFGYRESEYNIAVVECFFRFSPCVHDTIDANGVPRDVWGTRGRKCTGEFASRCEAVYGTPTRESADASAV